jgi:hypothetical protein
MLTLKLYLQILQGATIAELVDETGIPADRIEMRVGWAGDAIKANLLLPLHVRAVSLG